MYKIHVDRFFTRNPDLKLEHIFDHSEIRVGYDSGVYCVHFKTLEKYVRVEAGSNLMTPDYSGVMIEISPYIYDKDGNDLYETDFNTYIEHKDYYRVALVLETNEYLQATVIPLKYEYFVSFIRNDLVMNYKSLQSADVTVWTD